MNDEAARPPDPIRWLRSVYGPYRWSFVLATPATQNPWCDEQGVWYCIGRLSIDPVVQSTDPLALPPGHPMPHDTIGQGESPHEARMDALALACADHGYDYQPNPVGRRGTPQLSRSSAPSDRPKPEGGSFDDLVREDAQGKAPGPKAPPEALPPDLAKLYADAEALVTYGISTGRKLSPPPKGATVGVMMTVIGGLQRALRLDAAEARRRLEAKRG